MAKDLQENYRPENGNIIVVVATGPDGKKLTTKSSKCGKTRNFCVAVPSLGATSQTAPIVTGALALLMEAVPNLPVKTYVQAILENAKDFGSPKDETGVGLLDVDAAYNWLLKNHHQLTIPDDGFFL